MQLNSIRGTDGKVTIPSIGALIGYFSGWSLVRTKPSSDVFTFTGTFGYINSKLWQRTVNGEYTRRIVIQVGKDKFYGLDQADGAKLELKETALTMEGVTLWPLET